MGKRKREIRDNRRVDKQERTFTPAPPLKPKNKLQSKYLQAIESHPIVIATGFPGTGKTYIPVRYAATLFKQNHIQNIILTRPNVSSSTSLGYFKGTKDEKMLQWLAPVLGALRDAMSPGEIGYWTKEDVGRIQFCPLEVIKGVSWKNSFVIIDEAEDCTFKELRAILTRIGTNTTVVLCGDTNQTDLPSSGLIEFLQLYENDPSLQEYVSHVDFNDVGSIVRSEACRQLVLSFNKYNRLRNQ